MLHRRSSVLWERCWATSATSWHTSRVVDRVLDRVGDGRVALADVEAQVDHQPLADLALGLADAVVGVEREAGDLDRDRLRGLLAVLVDSASLRRRARPVVAGSSPSIAAQRSSRHRERIAHRARRRARGRRSPRARSASTLVAIVPGSRRSGSAAAQPAGAGAERAEEATCARSRSRAGARARRARAGAAAARGCARAVLPKPIPGSSMIALLVDPGRDARTRRRSSRNALTSSTTSS